MGIGKAGEKKTVPRFHGDCLYLYTLQPTMRGTATEAIGNFNGCINGNSRGPIAGNVSGTVSGTALPTEPSAQESTEMPAKRN